MKNNLIVLCFMAVSSGLQAQELQKLYFPNGKIAFEGKYTLVWTDTEPFEYLNRIAPETLAQHDGVLSRWRDNVYIYKDIVPNRMYEGKCKFYYANGALMAEGTYKNGAKHGDFKLFHSNGNPSATQSYVNGMATGQWKAWDKDGNLTTEFNYKPIPEQVVDEVDQYLQLEMSGGPYYKQKGQRLISDIYGKWFEEALAHNSTPVLLYQSKNLSALRDKVEKINYYAKAYKHGSFKVWENKQLSLQMAFDNNKPIGKWISYENGNPLFELEWKNEQVVAAKDYKNPANNFGTKAYDERVNKDKERQKELETSEGFVELAGLTTAPQSAPSSVHQTNDGNQIFRTVQEKASTVYNWDEYLQKKMRYPEAARSKNISGRVTVEFVVERDGSATGVKVIRGIELGHGLPEEAVRLVKASPKWKPGKQNGKPVRSYYTLPITFKY